jgi:hypothetical protein
MHSNIPAEMNPRSRSCVVRLASGCAVQAWLALALLASVALAAPQEVEAAAAAKVESVQVPAWVLRNGTRLPVNAGLPLEAGDILTTGPRARLLIRLAEGSLVKLGADAELKLQALKPPSAPGGLFEGLLDVVKGAFRFTTTLLSKAHRRRLDIRIASVTAGIRGTDVWGKAAPDKDIVCLIEGEISVQRGDDAAITMSDPLSFYVAPKGQPPLPVRPVDPDQLRRWALETDIEERGPALTVDGAWTVFLESLSTREAAARSRTKLEDRGFPISIQTAQVGDKTFYRVALTGFRNWQGAVAFKDGIADDLGFRTAWAVKQ